MLIQNMFTKQCRTNGKGHCSHNCQSDRCGRRHARGCGAAGQSVPCKQPSQKPIIRSSYLIGMPFIRACACSGRECQQVRVSGDNVRMQGIPVRSDSPARATNAVCLRVLARGIRDQWALFTCVHPDMAQQLRLRTRHAHTNKSSTDTKSFSLQHSITTAKMQDCIVDARNRINLDLSTDFRHQYGRKSTGAATECMRTT